MNPLLEYFIRCFMRYFFNVHSPFGTIHDHITCLRSVEQYRHVKLFYRVRAVVIDILGYQHLIDYFSGFSCLNGNQRSAEYIPGDLMDLLAAFSNCHTALLRASYFAFPVTARMDLRLYDGEIGSILNLQVLISFFRSLWRVYRNSFLNGYIISFQ